MLCENKTYVTQTYSCSGPFNSVQGTFNGMCHIITCNNEEYKGYILNNKKNGNGILKTKNVIYNGEWKDDKKHGNGNMCIKHDNELLIYDGNFENDKYMSKTIKYYNTKDKNLCKIYVGDVNSDFLPEDSNGTFIYNKNLTNIEISCKCRSGQIIEYNSYKTLSKKNEYDIDWKRKNDGWIMHVNYNNDINLDHVIEKNNNNEIIIIFSNGNIFSGNVIEENTDFKVYQNKCNGKYIFSNKNIFNGIIRYVDGKLKLEGGSLESYDKNGKKYVVKIFDGFYYNGEICNSVSVDIKYLYLGEILFSIYVKTKKSKINFVKVENKIISNIDIEFDDKYFYDCESGEFDLINGEQMTQYTGNTKKNKLNGDGELYFLDGKVFSGLFVDSIFKRGSIIYPSGKKYIGEFVNGKPHGKIQVEKNNEIKTEYYVYGVKTNLLYLKNIGKNIFNNLKQDLDHDHDQDQYNEMAKLKKD